MSFSTRSVPPDVQVKRKEDDLVNLKIVNPRGHTTNTPPHGRCVRIYVHGVFDLFHAGHTRFLKQVKNTFQHTYLIAGITEDHDTMLAKGLTVMTGAERAEVVRECKWVDEVIEDCPPTLQADFMERYNIDYFAHDDDYTIPVHGDPYAFVKEAGKFLVIPRVKGISTTEIISRILRDQETYVARQQKNGVFMEEMNQPRT